MPFFRVAEDVSDDDLLQHIRTLQPALALCDSKAQNRLQSLGLVPDASVAEQVTHGCCRICTLSCRTPTYQGKHQHGSSTVGTMAPAGFLSILGQTQMPHATAASPTPLTLSFRNIEKSVPLCIVSTSGSTGKPKYVLLSHEAVLHRMQWQTEMYPLSDDDVVMIKASPAFVDSLWETLSPAVFGMCPPDVLHILSFYARQYGVQ